MEPSDIRDRTPHYPGSNDEDVRVTDELNSSTRAEISFDQGENSHRSAHHASTTEQGTTMPSPDEGSVPATPASLKKPHSPPVVAPIDDSQGYPPSPPFKEAGPTSSVWHAYSDESRNSDSDMLRDRRGEVNILLVFAGLFSAVVSAFFTQSSYSLQPDYQEMSAILLFDQINIQRGLANGIFIDDIPTSSIDPTAPFTPDPYDLIASGFWLTSLTLSLATAFFATLVDACVRALVLLCFRKKSLSYILSAIYGCPPITTVPGLASLLKVKNVSEASNVLASEIYAAHKSCIENEVDALHWLYKRSSTSAIHRLVIQALAGLSPDHKARAEEVFSPHWIEIRDEKERMLMDCMELTQDGPTRWIPKDIPNIGGRIEPLLQLEILFPAICRKFPSRLFREYNLDFSRKLSNTLSITLSAIDDAHI
ncbi:uncharacterized protein ARMOST_18785 [Armillaria ostoyae]|uniref:DUF6535 domain-containing protein n=1 Tax=Armillaria ostoyae TaxID=47428 RepID=A0A284S2Q0_ARMOS|nr:uncharacterized protein ARMOST_18785 [Armillaria ostoyae]